MCRERPKFHLDGGSPKNSPSAQGESTGTVKVSRDSGADGTVRSRSVEAMDALELSDMPNISLSDVYEQ